MTGSKKSRGSLFIGLGLLIIIGSGFALRLCHLLAKDHYYILSFDSYFFHWLAEKVVTGEPLPANCSICGLHSGLVYPLAYLAKFISFVSGLPPSNALIVACKILPPLLGVISMLIIYFVASAIYDRKVGLFAAFTMAFLPHAYFIQAAGYLDRDGLSTLLIMLGAFAFFLLKSWRWQIGKLNVGWLLAGIIVAGIGELIYLEWVWVGRWLMLFVLVLFFFALLLKGFFKTGYEKVPNSFEEGDCPNEGPQVSGASIKSFLRRVVKRGATAVKESPWQIFLVVLILSAILEFSTGGFSSFLSRASWSTHLAARQFPVGGGGGGGGFEVRVAEMQGLTFLNVVARYRLFIIPLAIGIVLAFIKRREADLFSLSWFLGLLLLSLSTKRILISAIPAVCLLSGVGLAFLFTPWSSRPFLRLPQAFLAVGLTFALIFYSFLGALNLGSYPRMAADRGWYEALTYLREKTPKDAVVMSWWDYGYWILDLAKRRPVVDNGFYGKAKEKLQDIGQAYCTQDPDEIAQIMEKYGADYFIFSALERDIYTAIAEAAFSKKQDISSTKLLIVEDPLYIHFLWGDIDEKGPLKVVYRNPEVVILKRQAVKTPS